MTTGETRILLVDGHPAIRRELILLLAEEGVGICLEAGCREEALDIARREPLDLALVDLSLGEEDGLALLSELRERDIPVIVCSLHEEPTYVQRALAAGARGYITKREAPRDLARAVRDVLEGWMLVSPRAARGLPDGE